MPDTSARLNLPFIMPAQAQKHVTHNEALQILDALAQMSLRDLDIVNPPAGAVEGDGYAIGANATGDWAGHDGELAFWQNGGWSFATPQEGWSAWNQAGGEMVVFAGGGWTASDVSLQNVPGLGVGTSSDSFNKLAVASDATLLSHAGTGHQLKLNKAAAGDTASLLFQSNWAGHAEMGLAGDNDFHIKVSSDGASWTEAFKVDAATGHISGEAVQQSAADATAGRLARVDYVYAPGNAVGTVAMAGGVPTGALMESGSNANGSYMRFADGSQLCMIDNASFVRESNDSLLFDWTPPADFLAGSQRYSSFCVSNTPADWVSLQSNQIGVLRQDPASNQLRIAKCGYAPAFTTSAVLHNVRVTTWGRWA